MKDQQIEILMVAPGVGSQGGGGIANYANILTLKLPKNFSVKRIITLKENTLSNKLYWLGVSLFQSIFYAIGKNKKIAHINTAHNNSFWRKALFVKLFNLFNIPIVMHLHSSEFHLFFENSTPKRKESIRNIFKMSDKVIVLSESWRKWYIQNIENREPIVIYNGMDDFLTSNDIVSKRKNNILFLGRLGHRKGTYDLINAFKIVSQFHNDAKLILGGDGEIDKCKELVKDLNLSKKVEFLGWIDDNQKKILLNNCKIFTLPSYNEGFPLSILEAMSTRLAIVSSKAGGIPEEIVHGESGLLINPGDIKTLAKNIIKILDDNDYCDNLGDNARIRYLDNFTLEKILKDVESVYSNIDKEYPYEK